MLKWNPLVWENGILSNYSYICLGKTNVGTNNTYVILVSVLHTTNNNNIHSFQKNTTGWITKQVNIHILVLFAKFLELTDTEGSQSKIEFLPYMQHHFLLLHLVSTKYGNILLVALLFLNYSKQWLCLQKISPIFIYIVQKWWVYSSTNLDRYDVT